MNRLREALSNGFVTAHAKRDGGTVELWWTSEDIEPGGIVDFTRGDSVAEATIVDGEWTRLLISPDARNCGIYTAIMACPPELWQDADIWPQWIHTSANELAFYLGSGWEEDPERPGYIRRHQDRADAWLNR